MHNGTTGSAGAVRSSGRPAAESSGTEPSQDRIRSVLSFRDPLAPILYDEESGPYSDPVRPLTPETPSIISRWLHECMWQQLVNAGIISGKKSCGLVPLWVRDARVAKNR